MSDIPEIPSIETGSEIPTTDIPEVSEGDLNLSEETGVESEDTEPTPENEEISEEDQELTELGEKRNEDINEEIEDTLNNPQNEVNSHLIAQLREPEALDSEVGKEKLLEIDNINEKIKNLGNKAIKDINEISGLNPGKQESDINSDVTSEDNQNNESVTENNENPENKEETKEKWIDEELDPETEEFLRDRGEEDLTGKLTPEELRLYENFKQLIVDRFPPVGSMSSMGTLNRMLDSLPDEEDSKLKQVIKILLRTAVRLGTRVVAFVADEMVKSADKDDKTTKFIFGAIRDAAKGAESMADTAITGENKPERLTKTTRDFIFGKKKRS